MRKIILAILGFAMFGAAHSAHAECAQLIQCVDAALARTGAFDIEPGE